MGCSENHETEWVGDVEVHRKGAEAELTTPPTLCEWSPLGNRSTVYRRSGIAVSTGRRYSRVNRTKATPTPLFSLRRALAMDANFVPMLTSDDFVDMVLSVGAEGLPQIIETTKRNLADTRHSTHDQSSGHVALIDYDSGASSTAAPS
jgi:hypothetical protein